MNPLSDAATPILQLLMSVGAIVVQWRTSNRDTRTGSLAFLRIVLMGVATGFCVLSIANSREHRRNEQALRSKIEEQEQLLTKVGALQGGDREMLQKYLSLDHQMNLTFAQTGATDFASSVDKLLTNLPERKARRANSLKQADRLATQLWPQIDPVADATITQFDAHVQALSTKQIKMDYINRDSLPGAVTQTVRLSTTQVRAVSIGSVGLLLDVHPAKVDETGEVDDARIVLTLHDRPALTINVSQSSASLKKGQVGKNFTPLTFQEYNAQLDDPVQNVELRKAIGRALDDVFMSAIVRASDLEEEAREQ